MDKISGNVRNSKIDEVFDSSTTCITGEIPKEGEYIKTENGNNIICLDDFLSYIKRASYIPAKIRDIAKNDDTKKLETIQPFIWIMQGIPNVFTNGNYTANEKAAIDKMVRENYPNTEPVLTYWFRNNPDFVNYVPESGKRFIYRTRGEPYLITTSAEAATRQRATVSTNPNTDNLEKHKVESTCFKSSYWWKKNTKKNKRR